MHQIGLKLWSTNTDHYLREAKRLYEDRLFSYIELFVVPDTLDRLSLWKEVNIPFIVHNAHFMQGFNLAKVECESRNYEIYLQTKLYADALNAQYIIFHGGIDGTVDEIIRQLKNFNEPRALIENKPYRALPNRMGGEICRGSNLQELQKIINLTGCGFCLDFGHAVCSANSYHVNSYEYICQLIKLTPQMFHLTDLENINSEYDSHLHLGEGQLNFTPILSILPENAMITLETEKDSYENLNDFKKDILWLNL